MLFFLSLTFSTLMLIAVLASSSRTSSSTHNGVYRSITFQTTNPDEFDIRLVRANASTIDALLIKIATNWIPRFVLRYFEKDSNTADLFGARWALWKIVEYSEGGSALGFQPDNDTIVSSLHLWGTTWNKMYYTSNPQTDGSTIYNVCSNLTDPSATVTVCVHLTTKPTNSSGHHFDPNSIKWSLDIANYNFQSTNTLLALKVSFDTVDAVKDLNGTTSEDAGETGTQGSQGLQLASDVTGTFTAFADWVTTVTVTGTGCDATATVVKSLVKDAQWTGDIDPIPIDPDTDGLSINRTVRVSYFAFLTTPSTCRPTDIFWDPTMGVTTPDDATSTNSAMSVLPMAFLIAMILFSLL